MQVSNSLSKPLQPLEARVIQAISMEYLLESLDALMRIPSLGGSPAEIRSQELMAELMEDLGMKIDSWEIDFQALRRHPRYCAELDRNRGLGVVGTWGDDRGGRHLVLNGHTDVVPTGDAEQWTRPAWQATVEQDRVYGRGSCDMKGGLACALAAIRAVRDAGFAPAGKVSLHSVIGEEDGGCGSLATLKRGHRGDAAIIMEPTRCAVAPAQAGAVNFRLTVRGLAAHGCVREEGHSAIEAFIPVFQALGRLEAERNRAQPPLFEGYSLPWPLSVGTLKAGDWPSSVPDALVCEGRLGVAVGESLESARQQFESAVAAASKEHPWLRRHPPRVEWWGGQFESASVSVDDPIVTGLQDAIADLEGHPPTLEGMTFGADMRLLVLEGDIPTVMYGPGDVRRAHRPDEYVPLEDLRRVTSALALTILRFCG